jgi:hypothetical protein
VLLFERTQQALSALKPTKLCRLLNELLFFIKETGNLKLDKDGLDLFEIERIPFPSFKYQVSNHLLNNLLKEDPKI